MCERRGFEVDLGGWTPGARLEMKRTLFALLLACLVLMSCSRTTSVPVAAGPPSKEGKLSEPGRYQLVMAEYFVAGENHYEKGLFRIDTATGETDTYVVSLPKSGEGFNAWSPISDPRQGGHLEIVTKRFNPSTGKIEPIDGAK
jgi:hypothetical protein